MILILAHFQAYKGTITSKTELWHKLQSCLVKCFQFAFDDTYKKLRTEYLQNKGSLLTINIEHLRILSNVLCAQSNGQLRDPAIMAYMLKAFSLKHVIEEVTLVDLVSLLDAFYK